jgi:hypothetical protein
VETDDSVWIVQHDEGPDNTVLGVFASQDEAAVFAKEVQDQFVHGVITSSLPLGYRFDQGSSRYRAEQ